MLVIKKSINNLDLPNHLLCYVLNKTMKGVNGYEEYESKNYHGWYGEGDLSNPITPFTLIKVG